MPSLQNPDLTEQNRDSVLVWLKVKYDFNHKKKTVKAKYKTGPENKSVIFSSFFAYHYKKMIYYCTETCV